MDGLYSAERPPTTARSGRWVSSSYFIRNWAIWRQPRGAVLVTLITIVAAVALAANRLSQPIQLHQQGWATCFVLIIGAIAQLELSHRIERLRVALENTPHVNLTSVWTFAAVVTTSPAGAVITGSAIYLHVWLRVWSRVQHRPPHRAFLAWATLIWSMASGQAVLQWFGSTATPDSLWYVPVLGIALAAYFITNVALVMSQYWYRTDRRDISSLVGAPADLALELCTLSGGVVAALLALWRPFALLFLIPVLLVLHRGVLVSQLQQQAARDRKTGLYNASTWRQLAERELQRAARTRSQFCVLMLDLDHFKRVNDTHGHLAGDAVLIAVADILKSEIRGYDFAGRFGGEEFAVLLPASDGRAAIASAERIRHCVEELAVSTHNNDESAIVIDNLTISIGLAMYPTHGRDVTQLLTAADRALYTAKRTGRNRVVTCEIASVRTTEHAIPEQSRTSLPQELESLRENLR